MTQEFDHPLGIPQGVEQPKVFEWRLVSREQSVGQTVVTLASNITLDDIPELGSENPCGCGAPLRKTLMSDWGVSGDNNQTIKPESIPGYECTDCQGGYFDNRTLLTFERAAANEFRNLGNETMATILENSANRLEASI